MRLVVGLFAVLVSGAIAHADGDTDRAPPRPRVPLRVVRMLPESHQALLFDRARETHVLADVGATIEGYLVDEIADDEVTLTAADGAQVVLAAPAPSRRGHRTGATPEAPAPAPAPATPAPAKAELGKLAPVPLDPYGEPEIRSAEAPRDASAPDVTGAPGAPSTAIAPTAIPPTAMPTDATGPATSPYVPADAADAFAAAMRDEPSPAKPAATAKPALAGSVAPVDDPTLDSPPPATAAPTTAFLGRHEVDVALADFGALAGAVHGAFTATGVRLDRIAAGSLFAKAGLRAGDTITAVDGKPLRSLDAAADLYARASTVRELSVTLLRAGAPLTLRVSIQ